LETDLSAEQAYLDRAYQCLAAMRTRAAGNESRQADVARGGGLEAAVLHWHLQKRLAALDDTPAALCFGRLDHDNGDSLYVGRRHVEDPNGDPVVIDWRARASTPFYRATWADPMGLDRRRRFSVDERTITAIFDEDFTDPDSVGGGGLPDPLLAELERARTGEMRDIVATIQAEQDVVIRAPLEDLIVVQGGPGTGKTAVGLHRAAFLLYEHRALLERRGMLVVGPNRIFLRYIAQVLPSLGEVSVRQTTIDGLVGERVRGDDAPAVRAMKGDLRMAEVIHRHVFARIGADLDAVVLRTGIATVKLPAKDLHTIVDTARARETPLNRTREFVREQLVRLAWRVYAERPDVDLGNEPTFVEHVRAHGELRAALDRVWPSTSPTAVVRTLFADRAALAAAAEGVLNGDEQAMLFRRRAKKVADEQWTLADLALLDEADALLNGVATTYGHVVVDEAQDLSAMDLRMLARRAIGRSMTVLGDLAQATAPGAQRHWPDAVAALGREDARLEELALGYRVPAPVLDYANRLLPDVAPHVRPSQSVRTGGDPPLVMAVVRDELAHVVATEVVALMGRWNSIGVVVPPSLAEEVAGVLGAAGVVFGDARRSAELDEAVTLLLPLQVKGLEFDAVVVVEPARIVAEDPGGLRILYVALTRAVQHLGVFHAESLPVTLRG
jgi:DNA helicase IV